MKKLLWTLLILSSTTQAQSPFSTSEFLNVEMDFCGAKYVTKLGLFDRFSEAEKIFPQQDSGNFEELTSMALAADHWHKSFEVLMKCQREYAVCVDRLSNHLEAQGGCRADDIQCWLSRGEEAGANAAALITVVREYWPPFAAVPSCQNIETYIEHFRAGVFGVNGDLNNLGCIDHRDACRNTLDLFGIPR